MKSSLKRRPVNLFLFPLFVSLVILIFDQISKNFVQGRFNLVCNRGLAFGIGEVKIILPAVCLLVVFISLKKQKGTLGILSFSFILGGGVSNIVDRFSLGCVRDFISLGSFPSFNLADMAITFGFLGILYKIIFAKNDI